MEKRDPTRARIKEGVFLLELYVKKENTNLSHAVAFLPACLGDSLEVRRLRSPLHPPGLLHEQRRRPGGPWSRLHHPRIPQEPPTAL